MKNSLLRTVLIIVSGLLIILVIIMGTAVNNGNWNGVILPRILKSDSISNGEANIKPISVNDAKIAIETYLENFENKNLEISEIMVFDNQTYARIIEKDTGLGAFELIVDPSTLFVYHAQGPNIMWNVKYGSLRGGGIGESVMIDGVLSVTGSYQDIDDYLTNNLYVDGIEKTIDRQEAFLIAEDYMAGLDDGISVEESAKEFYGYYTFHTMKDGALFGLMSVNGYTGQVFIHTWHGEFIEIQEYPFTK
jgi:hypothetical protein